MNSHFSHVAIRGIAGAVPANCINIEDELEFFDNDHAKLARTQKIIGYGTRHVVEEGVTTVDLCEAAAKTLLGGLGESGKDIDALVLVNQSPAYLHPAGACILHGRLGLAPGCASFDVALGCSGYVYGLWLAHALIESGACRKLLLCAGDTPSIHTDVRNRLVNPLFGDAGTATLLCRDENACPAWFCLGTDGSGWHHIAIPGGGASLRMDAAMLERDIVDAHGNPWRLADALISGMPVFDFTIHTVPEVIREVLAASGRAIGDMDFIAMHQANRQIIDEIGLRLGLARGSIYSGTFTRYGNQSTASVAGVLCDALASDMAMRDMSILLCGFGVGFSWAAAVARFDHVYNGGIIFYEKPADFPSQAQQRSFWKRKFLGE